MQLVECSACDHHLSGDAIQSTFPDSFQRPLPHGSQTAERRGNSDVVTLHARPANRPVREGTDFGLSQRCLEDGCRGPRLLSYFRCLLFSKTASRQAGLGPKGRTDMSVTRAGWPPLMIRGSCPPEASPGPYALVPT